VIYLKFIFDQSVDLSLIKENLLKRQSKYEAELDVISKRLSTKVLSTGTPKNIVDTRRKITIMNYRKILIKYQSQLKVCNEI